MGFAASAREWRVLRQESVAGMDRISSATPGNIDDVFDIQVGLCGRCGTDEVGLVGPAHMERGTIHLRIDGHRLNSHLVAGTNYAHCNFAAVRNEDFSEHFGMRETGDFSPAGGFALIGTMLGRTDKCTRGSCLPRTAPPGGS